MAAKARKKTRKVAPSRLDVRISPELREWLESQADEALPPAKRPGPTGRVSELVRLILESHKADTEKRPGEAPGRFVWVDEERTISLGLYNRLRAHHPDTMRALMVIAGLAEEHDDVRSWLLFVSWTLERAFSGPPRGRSRQTTAGRPSSL